MIKYFKNWNKSKVKPLKIFYPKSKEEIISILDSLKSQNLSVHAYGSMHSNISIIQSDYLINTQQLDKLLLIDKTKKQVKVECGIKLSKLNKLLEKEGLALENMGETSAPTIGGLISTATHGTGHTGTMSTFIVEIELITPNNEILNLARDNNPDVFAAACISIGSLGIIYSVTLQCVPFYYLEHSRAISNWEQNKNNYKELLNKNDHFMFFLNPYTKRTLNYIWNKTDKKPTKMSSFFNSILDRFFFSFGMQKFWNKILQMYPSFIPTFVDRFFQLSVRTNFVDKGYELLAEYKRPNQNTTYNEQEIAIPVESFIEAAEALLNLIDRYKANNVFLWVVLFRFVKADHFNYLSPCHGRDSVYISITNSKNNHQSFYKEFQSLMLKFNGRPHWGKIHFLTHEIVKQLYGQNLEKFTNIRSKLDPNNIFANSFVKNLLIKNN